MNGVSVGHTRDEPLVRGAGGTAAAWYEADGARLAVLPTLLARLDGDRPLSVIVAPSGFGSSTLVRLWSASRERDVETVDVVAPSEELVDELLARAGGERHVVVCARAGLSPDPGVERLAAEAHRVDGAALLLRDEQVIDLWVGLGLTRREDRLEELARAVGGRARLVREVGAALLAGGDSPMEAARRVARDHLAGWVTDELSAEERAVVGGLAQPARLTAGSAAVVLRRTEAEAAGLLEWLARVGFVSRHEEDGVAVFRWPTAVRDVLGELLGTHQDRRAHEALAHWHVHRREPGVALTHVLATKDEAVARDVLGHAWVPLIVDRHEALRRFFRAAPLDWFTDPADFPHGVRQLTVLPPGVAEPVVPAPTSDLRTALNLALVEVFEHRRSRRVAEALVAGDRACALAVEARAVGLDEVAGLLSPTFLIAALMHELAGDVSGAVQPLLWAAETAGRSFNVGSARHAAAHLAMTHAVLGDHGAAESWLAAAAVAPASTGWISPRARIVGWVASVLVAAGRGDHDGAKVALRGLLTVRDPLEELWPFVLLARAHYTRLWGDKQVEVVELLDVQVIPAGSELDGLLQAARAELR